MIFNYKSWSGLKIALGVSIVLNVVVGLIWFYTVGEYGHQLRVNDGYDRFYTQVEKMEKCIGDVKQYDTEQTPDNFVYVKDVKTCTDLLNK